MANPSALTNLRSSFGAYFVDQGQGIKDIDKQFLIKGLTEQIFNLRPTLQTQERRVKADMTNSLVQRFQNVVSPRGDVGFEPRSIAMQDLKYEVYLDNMDALEESYIGFLADNDGNDRKTWPFVKWLVNELMLAKGRQDFELYEVYLGVYTSIASAGTANASGTNFTGIKKLLKNAAAASIPSNVVALGTVETDPEMFYKQVNTWVQTCKADPVTRMIIEQYCDYLCMSPELAERYAMGKDITLNLNYNRATDVNSVLPVTTIKVPYTTKLEVIGLPSMTGETGIFMTPTENRAAFIKRPRGESEFGIFQSSPYAMYIFAKFWKGIGFWHNEFVWTNQTATTPS